MSKQKIAMVTDTTCDLSDEVLKLNNIYMVPMQIVYETRSYRDRMEITADKVYGLLDKKCRSHLCPNYIGLLGSIACHQYLQLLFIENW